MGGDEFREELIGATETTDIFVEEAVNDFGQNNEWQGGETDCVRTWAV